jgi:hypothetical protein
MLIGAPGVMDWTGTLMYISLYIKRVIFKILIFINEGSPYFRAL